uniref:EOG090X07E6 n=1 Tax=Daphnia similis TaxID=35528 RepID=A0A4Y7LQY6_9CRUS|nr:EOG090X07E6 [Daphnia similis]SVE71720.1 EOG090X07E6 [Daphnia similis]
MAQLSSSPYALIVVSKFGIRQWCANPSPLLQGLRLSCQAYPPSAIFHFSISSMCCKNGKIIKKTKYFLYNPKVNLSIKYYCFSFVFIHIYTSLTTVHLKHILDLVSHTMVFYLGLEELINVKNIERLKKDLKVCYPLIDTILDGLNPKEDSEEFCDLTDYTDVLSCSERSTFEGILNCFAESVGTVFGCLRVHSKVAAATPNWWTLDSVELLQIQLLLSNERYDTGIDIPIYLPVRSPKIPFRLVQWKLTQNSDVCLLCGPTPSLADLEKEVKRFWRTAFALLKSAESCYPANIPSDITLDKNVLSYLVMNTDKRRSLSSLSPHTTSGDVHSHLTSVRKRDILRTFYKTIVGTMIDLPGPTQTGSKEVFMNFEYYSLHALVSDVYLILVLYPSGLHNHYLRSITRTTLKMLTHEKNCKW